MLLRGILIRFLIGRIRYIVVQFSRPTLFLEGAHSTFVGPEHAKVIQHFFPAAHRQVIENAGHWVHVENTEAFLQAVRAFVDSS